MTGIDRLRALAGAWDEWGLGGTLAEIADQIERELQEERDRWDSELCEAQMDKSRVTAVYLEMNKHVLGHEGMEDSPVARWARELRGALKSDASDGRDTQNTSCADPDGAADVTSEAQKVTRDPAEDVSMSAYDLLPADERDAIAWVREHGGLDYVKKEWRSRVPYDRYEARRQRLLGHIAECETALGRRRRRIEELGHRVSDLTTENAELRKRAMPEGCEWPTVDGRKVDFKTPYQPSLGVLEAVSIYNNGACEVMSHDGIIKPVSEIHVVVPAADGEPLEVGQTVWDGKGNGPYRVERVSGDDVFIEGRDIPYCGGDFTHQRPVLDADGVPIKKGDTVWHEDGTELRVAGFKHWEDGEAIVAVNYVDGPTVWSEVRSLSLTHTKPEPVDTWQRIEEDASECDEAWAFEYGHDKGQVSTVRDLVRRCRALAERERGE